MDVRRWESKLIRARPPRSGGNSPIARFGHSFNMDSDGYGYVFGGYTNDVSAPLPYLNDFYRIKLDSALGILAWENLPVTNGPSARESHSAVVNEQNGTKVTYTFLYLSTSISILATNCLWWNGWLTTFIGYLDL